MYMEGDLQPSAVKEDYVNLCKQGIDYNSILHANSESTESPPIYGLNLVGYAVQWMLFE